ncbi:MAG TPA: CPBP family intramembrane metalloprotease, partial [Flavobacteriales bacterium]|nr:CPBP family intramembrane metalloprotease [Flavobacteriales bacterium]
GLLYGSLRHVLDKHTAIAIASGVFTIIHVQYPWYLLALYILPLAVLLGYARANTGSIWTAVVLHLINNTVSLALPQLP